MNKIFITLVVSLATAAAAYAGDQQVGYSVRVLENTPNGAVKIVTEMSVVTLDGRQAKVPANQAQIYGRGGCNIPCNEVVESTLVVAMTPTVKPGLIRTALDFSSTQRYATPSVTVAGNAVAFPQDVTFHAAQTIDLLAGQKVTLPFGELLQYDAAKGLPVRARYLVEITANAI